MRGAVGGTVITSALIAAALVSLQTRGGTFTWPETISSTPPNFLCLVLDDVGVDEFETVPIPNIDKLGTVGLRFGRVQNIASVCSPSRMVLTGDYGRRHGIGGIVKPLEPNDLDLSVQTLPKKLKARQYSTGFFGKWHLSASDVAKEAPQLAGFDVARAVATHNLFLPLSDGSGPGNYTEWDRVDDGVMSIETEYATAAQVDATIEWWNATSGPKFAWLALSAAHSPYDIPPAEYLPPPAPPPGHSISVRERYELSIEASDNRIGHLLDSIDTSYTFIFVWSDNGTPPDALKTGQVATEVKGSMYEDGVATPLIVAGPFIRRANWNPPPWTERAFLSPIDVHDTILQLAGCGGATADSISFAYLLVDVPAIEGREWMFSENFEPNGPGPYDFRKRQVTDLQGYKLMVEESGGVEVLRKLVKIDDESTPIVDATKEAQLQAILDGI